MLAFSTSTLRAPVEGRTDLDARVVVVLARGCGVAREQHGVAAGDRLRPAVRALVAGGVEPRERLHGASRLRHPREPHDRVRGEVDESVVPQDAPRVWPVVSAMRAGRAAGRGDLVQPARPQEADPGRVGREERRGGALGLGHHARLELARAPQQDPGVPRSSVTTTACSRPSRESAMRGCSLTASASSSGIASSQGPSSGFAAGRRSSQPAARPSTAARAAAPQRAPTRAARGRRGEWLLAARPPPLRRGQAAHPPPSAAGSSGCARGTAAAGGAAPRRASRERRPVDILPHHGRQHVGHRLAVEELPAGEHLVHEDPEAPRCPRAGPPACRAPVRATCRPPCPGSAPPTPCARASATARDRPTTGGRAVARPRLARAEVEHLHGSPRGVSLHVAPA